MPLTRYEACVITGFTGITMVNFGEFQLYVEKLLGRPVWTHELGSKAVWEEIKEACKDEFLKICAPVDELPREPWQDEKRYEPEAYAEGARKAMESLAQFNKPVVVVEIGDKE